MIQKPMDVPELFPVRKSKTQKQSFRDNVLPYLESIGYTPSVEKVSMGAHNIVIGDPDRAKYLITAHYDTPASIGIPNVLTPCNPVTFLLYQLLVVVMLLAVSIGAAMLLLCFTGNERVALVAWYIVYFGILMLMMLGPANKSNANDNTSGIVTLLEAAAAMPQQLRDQVCFLLFDLEEAGLVGSAGHRNAHKAATESQVILNLDCVGDGKNILFFPVHKAKTDTALIHRLQELCKKDWGAYHLEVRTKGFTAGSSDHKKFPKGVGVMAFNRNKLVGYYCNRIHTWRDKILNYDNVTLLRDLLIAFIAD